MSTSDPSISEARIAAYLRGELSEDERAALEAAMDAQPHWLGVLALLAAEQEPQEPSASAADGSTVDRVHRQFSSRLRPGQTVGRFEVDAALGRGGMGSVYSAYDPTLRRFVALKILHASRSEDQPRLVSEARALAQVNHPHVITVHDVGRWDERVFVAMELLEGQTLQQWRCERARTWQEVLEVYTAAGRGVEAAHAAGIVHRDIKPSNLMITDGGRVVVVDFGLAVEMLFDQHTPGSDAGSDRSTRRAGTPAYMAPEQRRGEQASVASDQFSLCVALFEALEGRLPDVSAAAGRTAGFDGCAKTPRRVLRVVERGLAVEPAQRYPSMGALLDALRNAGNTPLWPAGLGLAGLLVPLLVWPAAVDGETCEGAEEALARVWTPHRRAALGAALRSPSAEWADEVADAVLPRLDAYTQTWLDAHAAACAGERDDDTRIDAQMLCLDRRLRQLDALLEVLERGELEVVSNATRAVDALPTLEQCGAVEGPTGASDDAEAEALRDRLAYADALREAASLDEAEHEVRAALVDAVARQDKWLEAEARLVLGWVEHDQGRHEAAEEQLRIAVSLATISRNDAVVAKGLDRLAWVVGYKLGRHAEGRDFADRADAWSTSLGGDASTAYRENTRGWIEHDAGRPAAARAHFERAAASARAASPSDLEATYDLGLALNGVGAAALASGELDAAAESFDRASALLAARLGPGHPRVAQILNNRAGVLRALGKASEALDVFERTLVIFTSVYGAEHVTVGQTAANMSVVLADLGRYEESYTRADQAVRVLTTIAGESHPLVAKCHAFRGDASIGLEDFEAGIRDLHRALAIEIELLGAEHPSVGISQSNLSIAYDKMGRLEEAVVHQERALEILVGAHGETHDLVAVARMNLAFLERKRGDYPGSLALYEQAVAHVSDVSKGVALLGSGEAHLLVGDVLGAIAVLEQAAEFLADKPPSMGSRGEAFYLLAQARWAQGAHADAKALARRAVETLESEQDPELAAEVKSWLRAPRAYAE